MKKLMSKIINNAGLIAMVILIGVILFALYLTAVNVYTIGLSSI